ncbi:ATP-binding protein [Sanguibacter sp. Z1732]|uniref:ATP-binding protein n=1 Tax=Sanguibacter sp. Z1732 TaxID=3435412 RepID=UPI003D9CA59B
MNRSGRSLLEELSEVFLATDAHNATRHVQAGLVIRQIREIPELAAREAIVNGVAHREWGSSAPTIVEHIGRTLRVTSPGGFFGGVNSSNIITHPSQSRNAALTQLLADLKVAEREGIGVDRMVREMVRAGHQPPDIREISGPFIRASLVGDSLDQPWIAWLGSIEPKNESMDVYSLLLLRRLVTVGWVDAIQAAPLIQLTLEEARGAISKLSQANIDGRPLLIIAKGTPEGTEAVWRLHPAAAESLAAHDRTAGHIRGLPTRPEIARSYAQARGRISSTELGSLVGASPSNVGGVLKRLATEDVLAPSSTTGRGRGFYYKWIGPTE